MEQKEKELAQREKALQEKEKALEAREKNLDAFSTAIQAKKEAWYDKVHLSVRQLDVIIWIVSGLLALVALLIILEATGVFKITA